MDDRTRINKQLSMAEPTLLNQELQAEKNRIQQMNLSRTLSAGSRITGAEPYTIQKKLETASGEADLYQCTNQNGDALVAKIYQRENPLKKGVAEAIKGIRSPYVARVYDIFQWNGRTVVILPYYRNGNLAGKKLTLEELKKYVIPNINEGLRAIHGANLLHKDLKPANIMLRDDNQSVAIIDFGISSLLEDGNTVLMTKTGMTPIYSAPELFNGLALAEADYYSFGITLYELYCGKTPYAGLSDAEIAKFTSIQRIPLPKEMPAELQQLIAALTYPDITGRNKKDNPNRRWTGKEVERWLKGEQLPSPGGYDPTEINPFMFHGKSYENIQELMEAMGTEWNEGKKILFHGTLGAHVKATNLELYENCGEAVRQASDKGGSDDIIYFEFLYRSAPQLKTIYWKGRKYESLPALGRSMLDALWQGAETDYKLYDSMLSEKMLTAYTAIRAGGNEALARAVDKIETLWLTSREEKGDPRFAYYMMAYLLSNHMVLKIENEEIHTVSELADFLNSKLEDSVKTLIEVTHKMVSFDGGRLDVQLAAWLAALGKQDAVDRWREILQTGGEET